MQSAKSGVAEMTGERKVHVREEATVENALR
jgi:hypothetical protein